MAKDPWSRKFNWFLKRAKEQISTSRRLGNWPATNTNHWHDSAIRDTRYAIRDDATNVLAFAKTSIRDLRVSISISKAKVLCTCLDFVYSIDSIKSSGQIDRIFYVMTHSYFYYSYFCAFKINISYRLCNIIKHSM